MAAKKAARPSRARPRGAASAPAGQLTQLRATLQELRAKLAQATHKRRLDVRMLNEAKRAREQVSRQMNALREQGRKLAGELRKALTESDRRHQAREQALAKIAELKAELIRKTEALKRKSHELGQLARESAHRARTILQGEQPESVQQHAAPAAETRPAAEVKPTSAVEATPPSQTPSGGQGV
jgi:chromosome segregation ATPase